MCSFDEDIALRLGSWDWYKLLYNHKCSFHLPKYRLVHRIPKQRKIHGTEILVWVHKIPGSSSYSFTVSLKTVRKSFNKSFNLPDFYCLFCNLEKIMLIHCYRDKVNLYIKTCTMEMYFILFDDIDVVNFN